MGGRQKNVFDDPGATPLTATITADAMQTWPAQVQPTVVASGGDGAYTYSWALTVDGIDYSARLSATNVANPTFTPLIGHRSWPAVCTISDGAGQSITKVYTLTLGDSEGWVDFPLDGGTLQDGTSHVVSRTSTSVTLTDIATPADADRPVIYRALSALLSTHVRQLAARYVMDTAWQDADRLAIAQMLITKDPTNIPTETTTFGGGSYQSPADQYRNRARIGTTDDSTINASIRGSVGWVVLDASQLVLGDVQTQGLDLSADGVAVHTETDWHGTDLSSGLYACARVYSVSAEGVGNKTITGKFQIRAL